MADRSNRKQGKRKTKSSGRPDLRKSHVAVSGESKTVRDARRRQERHAERVRSVARASRRSGIPVRPNSVSGVISMYVVGAVIVALVAYLGEIFHQWGLYGASESLWLYVLIGAFVAAAPVGYVSRTERDVMGFAAGAGVVSLAALLYERATFPACPAGASCSAYGALEQWGLWGSLAIGIVLTVVVFAVARLAFRLGGATRPEGIVTDRMDLAWGMSMTTLLIGLPLAATALFIDTEVRAAPAHSTAAKSIVVRSCFSDFGAIPALDVRPNPGGGNPAGTNFLVRRASEGRAEPYSTAQLASMRANAAKNTSKTATAKVPKTHAGTSDWLGRGDASPYEAAVGVNGDGEATSIDCRLISPGNELATAADVDPTSAADLQSGASSLSTNGYTFQNSAATSFLNGTDAKGQPFSSTAPAVSGSTPGITATPAPSK